MRFGSVCSGIEAASVAWTPLGWEAAWLSEIEKFPSGVLAHHYPGVPNLGDMTALPERIRSGEVEAPDLFCGGTPCQAFSVAGYRRSLQDARGNLSLTFCEIADAIDSVRDVRGEPPVVIFWENVPGVLNTKDNAFGCFLAGIAGEDVPLLPPGDKWTNAGCVYGPKRAVAWRVLDAQYFGVAQRRKRVFVVASARDGFNPAEVLFEFQGVRRDTAPSREAGQGASAGAEGGARESGETLVGSQDCNTFSTEVTGTIVTREGVVADTAHMVMQTIATGEIVGALCAGDGTKGVGSQFVNQGKVLPVTYSLQGGGHTSQSSQGSGWNEEVCFTQNCTDVHGVAQPVTYDLFNVTAPVNRQSRDPGDPAHTLARANAEHAVAVYSVDTYNQTVNPTLHQTLRAGTAIEHSGAVAQPIGWDNELNASANQSGTLVRGGQGGRNDGVLTSAMHVRRLTPTECERLQGFPMMRESLIIHACGAHQSSSVHVALRCLRSQNNAWSADEKRLMLSASIADAGFSTRQAGQEPHVALLVRMQSEDELLEIRSQGRLIWSASGAESLSKSAPLTLCANTVQELARLLRVLVRTVAHGRVESLPSIRLSLPVESGSSSAGKYTPEIEGCANDAERGQKPAKGKSTTLSLGRVMPTSDSIAETLCCSVLRATSGFIPSGITTSSLSVELTVETPYTAIPWRGKPASDCPDGPRYKALGNSWAVPVVRWIGSRIAEQVVKQVPVEAALRTGT